MRSKKKVILSRTRDEDLRLGIILYQFISYSCECLLMPALLLSTTCNLMWQNMQAYASRICLRRSHSKTCQSCRGWICQNSSPKAAKAVSHLGCRRLYCLKCYAMVNLAWNSLDHSQHQHLWRMQVFAFPRISSNSSNIPMIPYVWLPVPFKACVATLITQPRQLPGPYQIRLVAEAKVDHSIHSMTLLILLCFWR